MALGVATVFGGTGYLGRRIVARLSQDCAEVRVAARNPQPATARRAADPSQIRAICADVRDEAAVAGAVAGAEAVVNAVGLYVERGGETFEAVHVRGAENVARQAARAGVSRLVHVSGIGADPRSASSYVRARAVGEARAREAFEGATVLRPSVLFGPDDAFFNTLAGLARRLPVLPLFGAGETRLQPVYVDDVAEAAARALADPAARGRIYELGGPATYSYRALLSLVLAQTGRRRPLLPVPFLAWHALARLAAPLPGPPLTRDQVVLMEQDNVVGPDAASFADLGIEPRSVEDVLPGYLGPA